MLEVKRTLVKSGPELWAEVADPAAIARHLGPFGSVRITRAEPERLVEWEGERARGAVRLEPSGFGTRVVLAADTRRPAASAPEPVAAETEPVTPQPERVAAETEPVARRGLWARLRGRRTPAPEPLVVAQPAPEPPAAGDEPLIADDRALAVLTDALDALGTARHRPFSRV